MASSSTPIPGRSGPECTADGLGGRRELVMAVMGASHRIGGAERGTIETAAADATRGKHWLIVLRDTGPGEPIRLCTELGVEFVLVESTRTVRRLVRDRQPTILYVFGLRWSVPLRLAMGPTRLTARLARRTHMDRPRFIVAQRGLDVWRKPWHRWADRYTHWLVDRYIANSQAAADMLINRIGIPAAKVSVLRTGLGEQWLTPPNTPRERPGQPAHLVIIGNDRPEKALDDAVTALAAVADLDWQATIYTDAAERLAQVVGNAGLGERIRLITGHRVSAADLDAADLLLQTSIAESLPRAVLEAVARGVRVLASDVGDTASIIPASQLFAPRDHAEAAKRLRTWLSTGLTGSSQDQGAGTTSDSPWRNPQPVTVAHELDVADALRQLALKAVLPDTRP